MALRLDPATVERMTPAEREDAQLAELLEYFRRRPSKHRGDYAPCAYCGHETIEQWRDVFLHGKCRASYFVVRKHQRFTAGKRR